MNRILLILPILVLAHSSQKSRLTHGKEIYLNIGEEAILFDGETTSGGHGNVNAKENFHWNYQENGPDAWANKIEKCRGRKQSPINIDTSYVEFDMNLKPFRFLNYDLNLNWNLTHNGHTVQGKHIENEHISISGSDLDDDAFDLLQFHFHWGFNDFHGSEHLIDTQKYPLEMHLVHKSKSSGKYVILGILFELLKRVKKLKEWQEITINLQKILNSYDLNAKESEKETNNENDESLNPEGTYKNIMSMNSYYRYIGSLTTPPCTEGIIWNIFKTPINISSNQLQNFRLNEIKLNFRDIQKIYNRKVFSSFPMLHSLFRNSPYQQNQEQYQSSNKQSDTICKMNNFQPNNNSNKLYRSLFKISHFVFITLLIIF